MGILADNGNTNFLRNTIHQLGQILFVNNYFIISLSHSYIPLLHVALTTRQVEQTEDILSSVLLTKDLGNVIDVAYIMYTQDILHRNIAEQRDLLLGLLHVINRFIRTGMKGGFIEVMSRSEYKIRSTGRL